MIERHIQILIFFETFYKSKIKDFLYLYDYEKESKLTDNIDVDKINEGYEKLSLEYFEMMEKEEKDSIKKKRRK